MWRTEVEPGLGPGLGVRPRLSVEGEMLIIGIREMGMGMDVAIEDIAGVESECLGSGVEDFGVIISSCVDGALRWPVAMSPITETGTAMAIFVVFDELPEKLVESLVAEVVSEAEVMVEVDVREDVEVEVVESVGVDSEETEVVSPELVDIAGLAVSLDGENVVNSLTEGHVSVPGRMLVTGTAGSDQIDVSARLLFCPAVVVSTTSWTFDATDEVSVCPDVVESGVSASSSAAFHIANGNNIPIVGIA
ncbi:unnamed protein product [Penicillium glandicola]